MKIFCAKCGVQKPHSILRRSGPFIIKMVFGVFHLFIMKYYNDSESDFLAGGGATGRVLVYGAHFFNVPAGYALYLAYRYVRDGNYRNYTNRYMRSWFI